MSIQCKFMLGRNWLRDWYHKTDVDDIRTTNFIPIEHGKKHTWLCEVQYIIALKHDNGSRRMKTGLRSKFKISNQMKIAEQVDFQLLTDVCWNFNAQRRRWQKTMCVSVHMHTIICIRSRPLSLGYSSGHLCLYILRLMSRPHLSKIWNRKPAF